LDKVLFETKSGPLEIVRSDDLLVMDLPALPLQQILAIDGFAAAIGIEPLELLKYR